MVAMASVDALDNLDMKEADAPEVPLSAVLRVLAACVNNLAAHAASASLENSSSSSPSSSSPALAKGIAAPSFKAVTNSTRLVQ